ncbi:MAG TPA: hypothetical protein VNO70_19175, partial [Blastocatellia bacterium]|nr:hypothetical protein [Blastocatellia bacterium]
MRQASRSGVLDAYTLISTQKMIAVCKGLDGDHHGALKILENLFPIANSVRWPQPQIYFDYLNSCAVELAEVGRLEEARRFSQIVLASPFSPAYPEWGETLAEITEKARRASRSVVAVHKKSRAEELASVFRAKRNRAIKESRSRYYGKPAKVLPFPLPDPFEDVADKPRKVTPRELKKMGLRTLQATLITVICGQETSRETLEKM